MWILIGAFAGYFIGHSWLSALAGAAIAWWVQGRLFGPSRSAGVGGFGFGGFVKQQQQAQQVFMRALFGAVGHLAKADGAVSQAEIRQTEQIMNQLNLRGEHRKQAQEWFRQGKSEQYPLETEVQSFMQLARNQPALRRMFLEILLATALADGTISQEERRILAKVTQLLGFDVSVLETVIQQFQQRQSAGAGAAGSAKSRNTNVSANPYQLLGIDKNASNAEIKQAYRRLMSQYHPDKLVAKGLPDEMRDFAGTRVREVRAAYDQIREARGFR